MKTTAENLAEFAGLVDEGPTAPVEAPAEALVEAPAAESERDDPFAFLLDDTEHDLVAEFAAVGTDVTAPAAGGAAERQATASMFLRLASQARAEARRLERARDYEVSLVEGFYAVGIQKVEARARQLEAAVEAIAAVAREAGDFGKKKSAATPFGEFGYRERQATVELDDATKVLDYAREHAPDFVKAVVTLPYQEARETFTEAEMEERASLKLEWGELKKTLSPESKELPPGVAKVPASRTYYAKPVIHTPEVHS